MQHHAYRILNTLCVCLRSSCVFSVTIHEHAVLQPLNPQNPVCLSLQLIYIQHHHHHLMQHLSKLELEKGQLCSQLTQMKQKFTNCSTENVRLQAQVQTLQQQFDQRQQHGGVQGAQAGGMGGSSLAKPN